MKRNVVFNGIIRSSLLFEFNVLLVASECTILTSLFLCIYQFCNMFEHLSPSEWLLYISEWQDAGQQASNIRVTTKIAVNALLHSDPKVSGISNGDIDTFSILLLYFSSLQNDVVD